MDFRAQPVETDIWRMLHREGDDRVTTEKCRAWARQFIKSVFPWWTPGTALSAEHHQILGARYMVRLHGRRVVTDV